MMHLGDITKISGYDAPTVNVIIGGSPCQDLSISGNREGLKGKRSGLFMEMIRIIREMREKDENAGRAWPDIRPRFMVWENVPGAFTVNGGWDFAAVIEETAKTAQAGIPDVLPPSNGWPSAGCFLGDGWSIAWRVFDAQFWGVPQRRRRIALVADFGGGCAPEILFEREGMQRNSEQSKPQKQRTADGIGASAEGTSRNAAGGILTFSKGTKPHTIDEPQQWKQSAVANTLNTFDTGDNRCSELVVYDARGNGDGSTAATITGDHDRRVTDYTSIVYNRWKLHEYRLAESASTLSAHEEKEPTDVVCAAVDARNGTENPDINGTLQAKESSGSSVNLNNIVRERRIVRRLTPIECERLQGFPDGWTNIGDWTDTKGKQRKTSDAMRYKALGNSIALMPWVYVLARLSRHCDDVRMASLFDGIGGFPLIWAFLHGRDACIWASEIDGFPIAVTKRHFPEKEDDPC